MKKIYYLLFVSALAMFSSCQEPEFIEPTAERQGITSLTAYFTTGKNVEKEMGKLVINDPEQDRFVIPIPWYYPEESDEETLLHMSRVRVRAELAPNCKIDPPLTILGDSRSTPRSLSALEWNPQVPAPTPHNVLGPGIVRRGILRSPLGKT